ncbi:MAG: hypothetical protein U5L07_07750 [Desulfobacterales bacterium]|nr:hypothetical protein [Desulfobacterales bacterium]
MEDLINAIITELQGTLTTVRASAIWAAESLNPIIIPEFVTFPAVAVKDGRETFAPGYQDGEEIERYVDVAALVQVWKEGEAIVGADGVLRLYAAIRSALNDNTLSLSGYTLAVAESAGASKTIFTETDMAQMKVLTLRYEALSDY